MNQRTIISGQLVDVWTSRIYPAEIVMEKERIISIQEKQAAAEGALFILPGFIDSHVHIESSMLIPSEFARLAVVHGTVATVSDPHEIANVCGMAGVEFMISNGNKVPFKFNFGAPSCVPATSFETAGATISAKDIEELMRREEILYLSEMMNFPGVLQKDPEVMQKIASAHQHKKPVDGHAPGLRGATAKQYIDAGISTDHECFTREEALDKLKYGMKILIREGSAARNFDALISLLQEYPDLIMFCSDDKHPDSLLEGHINSLCARAAAAGINIFSIIKAACVNPVNHYKLKVGLLRQNDFADFVLVKDLKDFEVVETYINGQQVAANGRTLIPSLSAQALNQFHVSQKKQADFIVSKNEFEGLSSDAPSAGQIPVIEARDGQLITGKAWMAVPEKDGMLQSSIEMDCLKMVVVNRYRDAPVAKAFVSHFGLQRGAIASSVAHDSHNIVAVGVDDESICRAVNLVIAQKGGVSYVDGTSEMILPLPVAGLMSTADGFEVARQYAAIDQAARGLGSKLGAPYMTLSFMALLVIPHLKLSDKGLFDGDAFRLITQAS